MAIYNRQDLLAWVNQATQRWWERDDLDCLLLTEAIAVLEIRPNYGEDWDEFLGQLNLFVLLDDIKRDLHKPFEG